MTNQPRESRKLAVVAAVNDSGILAGNLARSPAIVGSVVDLHTETGHSSASAAYNAAIDRLSADLIIFAHQDVYLPSGTIGRLLGAVEQIERDNPDWGLIGVVGLDMDLKIAGEVWDPRGRVGELRGGPCVAAAMDELLLVLRRSSGLRFDAKLPGFHLYAADMIQMAADRGLRSYIVDCPVIHNSGRGGQLGASWDAAYRYMQRKWRDRLPIPTLIMPVGRTAWPLMKHRLRVFKGKLLHRFPDRVPEPDAAAVARRLGYELPGLP